MANQGFLNEPGLHRLRNMLMMSSAVMIPARRFLVVDHGQGEHVVLVNISATS